MTEEFNSWWNNGESLTDNPYELDSAAYWAWEGWCAAVKAEREACAKYFDEHWRATWTDEQIADAIRARGQE
jgi:hypothetical protein